MSKLRAIFFDIDDTLYSTTEFAERARSNGVQAMIDLGLRLEHDSVMRELREVIAEFPSNYEFHFDKLLLRLPPGSYESVNPAILVAGAVIAYHRTTSNELKPFPDAMACLEKLNRTDLILGVITQGATVKQAEKAIRLGILEYISPSALFISRECRLPSPAWPKQGISIWYFSARRPSMATTCGMAAGGTTISSML